jgi:DNA-binding NarL/FixJ family response regulator
MQRSRPILLAGDCRAEWATLEGAVSKLGLAGALARVTEFDDALAYLRDDDRATPCVVLVSIDTSGDDGLATLRTLKADARLRSVPVVVLASSHDPGVVSKCFALGAAGYLVEPADCLSFAEAIRRIYRYWSLSELPQRC